LDGNVFYIQTDPYTFNYTSFNTKLGTSGFMNKPVNANSSTADPLLVYPIVGATEDFHLGSGSPCIDHATTSGCGRTTDYDGNPIVGTPDIGAIELTRALLLGVPSSTLPSVGDRFTFDTVCKPPIVRFDAYGVIITPEGKVYSFDLKNPAKLRAGIRPLALSVAGIRAVYRKMLYVEPSVFPCRKGNTFTFILGLVPAGAKPSVADAFPGCLWQGTVSVR